MSTAQDMHLPWKLSKRRQRGKYVYDGSIFDANNVHVVASDDGYCGVLNEKHADFIITACNNHQELLEACVRAFGVLDEPGMMDIDQWKAWRRDTVTLLHIVIAKAKEAAS